MPTGQADDLLRGCKEIAAYIGFSEDETQRKAFDAEIPAFKVGNIWHMSKQDWDNLIAESRRAAVEAAGRIFTPSYLAQLAKLRPEGAEQRRRRNARVYANVYKRRGHIPVQVCEKCGADNAEMHHDNYDEPLLVRWLCRVCHLAEHRAEEQSVSRETS